jgi:hypothetical protein
MDDDITLLLTVLRLSAPWRDKTRVLNAPPPNRISVSGSLGANEANCLPRLIVLVRGLISPKRVAKMEKAVIAAGLTGALWLADYGLGFTHDLGMQKSGLRALEYLLREEAAGRASVVEPFITTARGANANKDFLVG